MKRWKKFAAAFLAVLTLIFVTAPPGFAEGFTFNWDLDLGNLDESTEPHCKSLFL